MPAIFVHKYKRSLRLRSVQRAMIGILLREKGRGRKRRPLGHRSRSPTTEHQGSQDPQKQSMRISKKTALRPVASCSPRPPDVPGAYNVNSSSGCFHPGWFRLGATLFRPDTPGVPWRSLPSNHTPSTKPLPPAAPEAPVRLPPPPEAFRP